MAVLLSAAYMYLLISLVDLVVHTIVWFVFLFCTEECERLGLPTHEFLFQTVRRRPFSFIISSQLHWLVLPAIRNYQEITM